MNILITRAMLDALQAAKHVPPDVQRRLDAAQPEPGSPPVYRLQLSEDEGIELSELLQWHVRTDAATGKPTPDTAAFAEVIRLIGEAQV